MKTDTKKYECSKHGKHGEITCPECCQNLLRLLNDHNATVISDDDTWKELGK